MVGEENYFKHIVKDSPSYIALSKEIYNKPDFDFKFEKAKKRDPIFYSNPEPNWGPKKAAKKR